MNEGEGRWIMIQQSYEHDINPHSELHCQHPRQSSPHRMCSHRTLPSWSPGWDSFLEQSELGINKNNKMKSLPCSQAARYQSGQKSGNIEFYNFI